MKEIIEKYKKGELTVGDLGASKIQYGDRLESKLGQHYNVMKLDFPHSSDLVIMSIFLEKEIAAMEKQPELTKENSPQGVVSRISNRLHNIGCEHQNSELGEELGGMACEMWEVLPMISNEEKEEKQPTEYEYIKVTNSIFDLKVEFEAGDLFFKSPADSGGYRAIEGEDTLIDEMSYDNVYRRVVYW